eukprot:1195945-Prorocentrum_minimum.AAC.3
MAIPKVDLRQQALEAPGALPGGGRGGRQGSSVQRTTAIERVVRTVSEGSTKRHSDPIKTFANYQLATTTQYVFLKGAVYKGWSVAEAPGGLVATILLDRA